MTLPAFRRSAVSFLLALFCVLAFAAFDSGVVPVRPAQADAIPGGAQPAGSGFDDIDPARKPIPLPTGYGFRKAKVVAFWPANRKESYLARVDVDLKSNSSFAPVRWKSQSSDRAGMQTSTFAPLGSGSAYVSLDWEPFENDKSTKDTWTHYVFVEPTGGPDDPVRITVLFQEAVEGGGVRTGGAFTTPIGFTITLSQ